MAAAQDAELVECPACSQRIPLSFINRHLDRDCDAHRSPAPGHQPSPTPDKTAKPVASIFQPRAKKPVAPPSSTKATASSSPSFQRAVLASPTPQKRSFNGHDGDGARPLGPAPPKKQKAADALKNVMPLADKMRPKTLDEVCGQDFVSPGGVLRGLIEQQRVPSLILWGPPGCGKTTIARVIAQVAAARFIEISATTSGVQECKKIFQDAKNELLLTGRKCILFCDEIHKFSKSQQDVFLAPVENGQITLIGATTENPSFKVQSALLSRCRTFVLKKLSEDDIAALIIRAIEAESPRDVNDSPICSAVLDREMVQWIARFADGDARTALNLLEIAFDLATREDITKDIIKKSLKRTLVYDRNGDMHYDTISAFHKSVRGSDPDATLFWLGRMIQGGEDPLFIARRMVVMASEDIGLADCSMLPLATATYTAVQQIGMPEARINLAHCAAALALAPKSTRAYRGLNKVMDLLEKEPVLGGKEVPVHLRNAPTQLLKQLGFGATYKYNPDYKDGRVKQEYLPPELQGTRFLDDTDLGTMVDSDLEEDV